MKLGGKEGVGKLPGTDQCRRGPSKRPLLGAQKGSFRLQVREHTLRSANTALEGRKSTRNAEDLGQWAASSYNVIKVPLALRNSVDRKTKRTLGNSRYNSFWNNASSPGSKAPR